ncbi:hypothetical protein [Nocardiopsis rhodophaea]|uniref:hypothetical protein n=1 Tax=Nocardiopsis rhodophaea TaxID=280238 RepID=UPI0031DFF2CC
MTADLLEPTGPHRSLRGQVRRPTAYRPAPDATPLQVTRTSEGLFGWVRLVPEDSDRTQRSEVSLDAELRISLDGGAGWGGRGQPPDRPHTIEDLEGYDNRPDPLTTTTAAEYTEKMRQFRIWSGDWSYRQLERFSGGLVARSTFHAALNSDELPRFDVVVVFITACGGGQGEVQRWVTAWRRLCMPDEAAGDEG